MASNLWWWKIHHYPRVYWKLVFFLSYLCSVSTNQRKSPEIRPAPPHCRCCFIGICAELFGWMWSCFTNFLWNLWTKILPPKKKFSHLYTWWFGGPGKIGNVCNSGIWRGLLLGYLSLKSKPPIGKRFKQVTIHGFQASSNWCLPL